jgi:predicted nucleotidyltransferase
MDRDEVMRVLRAFESARLEYVLIGAAAMGFHGLVRATEDVDLFIRATPEISRSCELHYVQHMKAIQTSTRSLQRICSANTQRCVTFHPRAIYILMC